MVLVTVDDRALVVVMHDCCMDTVHELGFVSLGGKKAYVQKQCVRAALGSSAMEVQYGTVEPAWNELPHLSPDLPSRWDRADC